MAARKITLPLTEELAKTLHAGDSVLLTGTIYTSRDAGHKRMCEALARGEKLPFDPADATIYYVGPTPAKPGQVIGSAGPTTSGRMDAYAPTMMSVGARGLTMVPIIQALAQLEKNYGHEGAEVLVDNCQDTIFGGFSPQSKTAEALSAALGSRTVLSGSVSQGKESSQSLQMMERPLMTPDELKSIPKGEFVVMKTGTHPMRTRLRLFLDWGITFDPDGYRMPERAARKIAYVNRDELAHNIQNRRENSPYNTEDTK